MNLLPNIEMHGSALFLKKERTLVVADLHLGYEEALNKKGILIPRSQGKEIVALMSKLVVEKKPKRVIFNGDFKHEFGTISETEWRHGLRVLDVTGDAEMVIIKGNHDPFLAPIARKRNIAVVDHYVAGDVLFLHGDSVPEWLEKGSVSGSSRIREPFPKLAASDGATVAWQPTQHPVRVISLEWHSLPLYVQNVYSA